MKHTGSCHCGEIKFEAEMDIKKVLSCNCSICSKRAHLLSFVPEESFKLVSGESFLSDYQFGKKVIHHYFCKNCGIAPFGQGSMPDGKKIRSINVLCIDGLDAAKLPIENFDGKSM